MTLTLTLNPIHEMIRCVLISIVDIKWGKVLRMPGWEGFTI